MKRMIRFSLVASVCIKATVFGQSPTPTSTAVLPFTSMIADKARPGFGYALAELVSVKLEETGIEVLDRTRLADFIETTNSAESQIIDKDKLRRAGDVFGISMTIKGQYLITLNTCRISAKVIDTESGLIFRTFERDVPMRGAEIMPVLNELTQSICSVLDVPLGEYVRNKVESHGSQNIAALAGFGKGLNAHRGIHDSVALDTAAQHYTRALEADSTFALARTYRRMVYEIIGFPAIPKKPAPEQRDTSVVDFGDIFEEEDLQAVDTATVTTPRQTVEKHLVHIPEEAFDECDVRTTYYENGSKMEEACYKEDVRNGYSVYYFPNGSVRGELDFVDNRPDGTARLYYRNGRIRSEIDFDNGLRHGPTRVYHPQGELLESIHFEDGVPVGTALKYYATGAIREKTQYEEGKLNGTALFYYENGNKRARITYKLDQPEGVSRLFYKSGKIRKETSMKHGVNQGPTTTYYESGKIKEIVYFESGKEQGMVKSYFENGQLQSIKHVKNGVLEGEYKEYYANGALKEFAAYVNGKSVGDQISYYRTGGIREKISRSKRNDRSTIHGYYESGQRHFRMGYRDGRKDGKFVWYYPDGKVQTSMKYRDGLKIGVTRTYDEEGELVTRSEFENGVMVSQPD
ncbi:MAG: hypothetical protein GF398_04715 [Chitinivibrionales bacterium]|nr:hypothetical protein [Chitinivibrionales bacterium]